jgi:hypothetical protein
MRAEEWAIFVIENGKVKTTKFFRREEGENQGKEICGEGPEEQEIVLNSETHHLQTRQKKKSDRAPQ